MRLRSMSLFAQPFDHIHVRYNSAEHCVKFFLGHRRFYSLQAFDNLTCFQTGPAGVDGIAEPRFGLTTSNIDKPGSTTYDLASLQTIVA